MQLITGGMGFVGLHVARAFLDMEESCVLTRFRTTREPGFIKADLGKRLFVEELDASDRDALLRLGDRHDITGIVHLAPTQAHRDAANGYRTNTLALLNVLGAAEDWGVRRVTIASTIGVYAGSMDAPGPLREDLPLRLKDFHPIPTFKKISELLAEAFSRKAGFQSVSVRFGAWGPLSHHPPSPMNIQVQMVHAAVRGEAIDFSEPQSRAFAEDGADVCYVKDCARAFAMLQLAKKLNHTVYNAGMGRAVKNREFLAAVKKIIPETRLELPEGFDPNGLGRVLEMDLTRIREDTGYASEWDVERGVADYVAWLRAGHEF